MTPRELLAEISGVPIMVETEDLPEPKPFALWRASDFAAHVTELDADVLGKAVIRSGNLTVLIGQGGLGKSSWALAYSPYHK